MHVNAAWRLGVVVGLLPLGVAGGLSGCAGGSTTPSVEAAPIGGAGEGAVGERAAGGGLDARALARDVAHEGTFVGERGELMRICRFVPETAGGEWRVLRFLGTFGDSTGSREQRFVIDDSGSLVLLEEINRLERVEVVFTPGLVVLPGGLEPGQVREQVLEMVVHPLGDRSRVKSKGAVTSRVTFDGEEEVDVPIGRVRALKVRSGFVADLKPARVDNQSTQWFVPGLGLVREVERERTVVLGVTIRNNAESWTIQGTP